MAGMAPGGLGEPPPSDRSCHGSLRGFSATHVLASLCRPGSSAQRAHGAASKVSPVRVQSG